MGIICAFLISIPCLSRHEWIKIWNETLQPHTIECIAMNAMTTLFSFATLVLRLFGLVTVTKNSSPKCSFATQVHRDFIFVHLQNLSNPLLVYTDLNFGCLLHALNVTAQQCFCFRRLNVIFFSNKFPVVWLSAYQKTSHWTVSPVIVSPNFSMAGFDLQYISLKRSQTGKKLVIMNTFPSIAVYILLGLVQNSWTFFVLCGLTKPQFPVKG